MNAFICVSAWLTLAAPLQGSLQINVDAKTGETISGEKDFRVTVSSGDTINQVEFYVGDELRETETSTPYMFPLDTVQENDGTITVRFKAYTDKNKTIEKSITLRIDNQKSKGADFHVKEGLADLSERKFQQALVQGRIALKIEPKNGDAELVLSRANLGLKIYDQAQRYAEDAVAANPKNDAALQILASVDAQRAFSTFAHSDADRADVMTAIGDAFHGAVDARRKSLDLEVDAVGAPTDSNIFQYADTADQAERYSLTVTALQPRFLSDPKNVRLGDRIAYAQLRSGRYKDAMETLNLVKSQGTLDAYGYALLAVTALQVGHTADADAAIKSGIEADPDNLGVRTAQAYIALKENKNSVLSGLATDLARDQGQRASVNYYLMALADRQQRFADARRYFETGVLAEPAYPDLYIEQANYSLGQAMGAKVDQTEKDRALATAKMYYQTALLARPEAVDALVGMSLVYLVQRNGADAVRYAEAARSASPDEAAGHYALAAALQATNQLNDARAENEKAGTLDGPNLSGRSIPDAAAVWRYLISAGRIPVMAPPQG